MVCGNASLEATIATVFRTAEDVLQYCPGCSSRTADLSAQAMFGRDLEVTDVQHPRVIITTALADRNPPALELICNYKPSGTRQCVGRHVLLQLLLCTSRNISMTGLLMVVPWLTIINT